MDAQNKVVLLSGATSTGSWVQLNEGGRYNFEATATDWNGATVLLQRSPNGGTNYYSVAETTLSEDSGWAGIDLGAGYYRAVVTGSPTGMDAALYGVA